ncbi:uncharacterized protein LOC126818717 [Patella vulgata]|uniref:uncharacterized protein LOC126818717 n=1 Tax=Patella vulgata TaxID=6465 RepID=UPI00217F4224|nr:uncharacterized protein LOC126818717 [Patella vulgata]
MADKNTKVPNENGISSNLSELAKDLLHLDEASSLPSIRPGSQLADKLEFKDRSGNTVSGYPVIVDFRRILQLQNKTNPCHDSDVIQGISNSDLLHAVVGLYDIALSEMTLDVLYATVCERWARTIVLVQDVKDALNDVEERKKKRLLHKNSKDGTLLNEETAVKDKELKKESIEDSIETENEKDIFEEEESQPSKFEAVFSDTDDDEDEEEDEDSEDEDDFSHGINSFIKSASKRRKIRNEKEEQIDKNDIGVENRIIGCLTFEKKYVRHRERVIHLTILTVRPRYRKYGIGKFLLSQVVDPAVTGQYEAVVVHADNGAVDFFQKFGFSDDLVLNSRWSELAEQFTNCTLMCYLPGFTGHSLLSTVSLPGIEAFEMEQELKKWKDKTLESYQAQMSCIMRMKHEILQLQKKVKSQDEIISTLALDNERIKQEKSSLEKELRTFRIWKVQQAVNRQIVSSGDIDDDITTEDLINELQQQVDKMDIHKNRLLENGAHNTTRFGDGSSIAFPYMRVRSQQEPYDHMIDAAFFYDTTQQFKDAMHSDPSIKIQFEVTSINKSILSSDVKDSYQRHNQTLRDPSMVTQLYYCGGLIRPQRLQDIILTGFTQDDFTHGEFGKGIYFSKYPSKAAQFSALGKLILAEVGLGAVQTVTKPDRSRLEPGDGCDSIIVPGRLYKPCDNGEAMFSQEYVVFSSNQILPLCLINYETVKKDDS